MEIKDLLIKDVMLMDLKATSKTEAIDEMVQSLYDHNRIDDIKTYKEGILAREAQTSTGLGDGIAMPHAKNKAVKEATVLFAKSNHGVDYDALDGQPVYLFFMIAAPEGANDTHLQALAALSRLLIDPDFVAKLKKAETPEDVQNLFQTAEDEKEAEETQEADTTANPSHEKRKFVVAVTACPTGIAHTYMAEDALKKKAAEMGVDIRVETNGSDGVKNGLTADEIANADAVIIAADKNVEMDRFDGKYLLNRPVSDGVRKPEELITLAIEQNIPVYHRNKSSESDSSQEDSGSKGNIGSQVYKHLMSGVSNMLPFVIGGGIAIAIAFLVDQFIGVPDNKLAMLGSYNEFAAYFKLIGDAAFGFMLPVFAGFIAYSMADRPGLVAGFVAGTMASSGFAFGNIGDAKVSSGFLGALVGGFLAGFVMIGLKKLFANLPKSLAGIRTILFYPVLGVIIVGFLMLILNIPMGAINEGLYKFLDSLSGVNSALLGLLLGGMMAIDLGGPINKAAYVFGTSTLATTVAEGGSVIMAAVMAGGMVPPLAIFVATRLFKNKYNKADQDAGLTNIVMGLSFITEGAIPFAAADPLRVIPPFAIGSAITGALVSAVGIKVMAPHGGIFVILLVSHPYLFIGFILLGAIISGVLLGLFKRKAVQTSETPTI